MQNKQNSDLSQNEMAPKNEDKDVSSSFIMHKDHYRKAQEDNFSDDLDDSVEFNNRIQADDVEEDINDSELEKQKNSKKIVR